MATGHLRHYVEHFLAPHPAREVRELFWSTAILDFAMSLVMVFEPIYLYSQKFSIEQILLFYAAVYVLYFFLLPIGGRICRRHGYEHTILLSSPFLILYYLSFFAISYNQLFIAAAVVALAIQKILYWPSYHSNFATWSQQAETGREISNMWSLSAFAAATAPVVGGVIVAFLGFKALFIVVSVLILLSNAPLLRTPEFFIPKPFSYGGALKRLVKKDNRRALLAFIGYGEEFLALVLWPIFVSFVIPNMLSLGAIMSLAMMVNVVVILYIGSLVDDGGKMQVLRSGAFFTAGSWLVRIFVGGGLGVFLIDSFYRVAKNMIGIPLVALLYEKARCDGATEQVIFFEMALSVGKILAALAAVALFRIFPDAWTPIFILAAGFTLLFAVMIDKRGETPDETIVAPVA
ncbi:MAG: MFS transporter [Patescibacteria group bacterium]|jgi:MFS family permease